MRLTQQACKALAVTVTAVAMLACVVAIVVESYEAIRESACIECVAIFEDCESYYECLVFLEGISSVRAISVVGDIHDDRAARSLPYAVRAMARENEYVVARVVISQEELWTQRNPTGLLECVELFGQTGRKAMVPIVTDRLTDASVAVRWRALCVLWKVRHVASSALPALSMMAERDEVSALRSGAQFVAHAIHGVTDDDGEKTDS